MLDVALSAWHKGFTEAIKPGFRGVSPMTMQDKISFRIMALVSQGQDVKSAIDAVLGEGTASKMIGELYDALRAKSAA